MEKIQLIVEIIESIAVITAALVALKGVNAWKAEARWKKEYELKEEVLTLFYNAQAIIRQIRSPYAFLDEGKTRVRRENETNEESILLDRAYIPTERYLKEKDLFTSLRTKKFRYKAVFGIEAGDPFDEIEKVLKDIFIAAQMLATVYWKQQGKPMSEVDFDKHLKLLEDKEGIIWSGFSEPDLIEERVKKAIKKIESIGIKQKFKWAALPSRLRAWCCRSQD